MVEKSHYYFTVSKNVEKSGAWLSEFVAKDREGKITKQGCSAWTTSAKAKKWCAEQIGRGRLTWEITASNPENQKPTSMRNHTEVRS
jgi:hypothetical protein